MSRYFTYRSLDELRADIDGRGLEIDLADRVDLLLQPLRIGPLTLQPGETWRLRHRFYIHAGRPEEADVAGRYQEYANPARVTILG